MNTSQIFLAFSVGAGVLAGLFFGIAIGRGRREHAITTAEQVAYEKGRGDGYGAGCADTTRAFHAARKAAAKPVEAPTTVMTAVSDHTAILPRQPDETATFARPPIQHSWGNR